MSKKLKKQQQKVTVLVFTILFSVWLIVSSVFCVIVVKNDKDRLILNEQKSFSRLINRLESYPYLSYGKICLGLDSMAEHYDAYLLDGIEEPIPSYGAYPYHDNQMQIIAYTDNTKLKEESDDESVNDDYMLIMDTDKNAYAFYNCIGNNKRFTREGNIDYEHFRNSMSDEQYQVISKYLLSRANYYELICTSFYYISPGRIIPKTADIVKTTNVNPWNGTDTFVQSFSFNPSGIEKAQLCYNAYDTRDVIPGDFVVGNYSSGGLIQSPYAPINYNEFDLYNGKIEKVGRFTYTFENRTNIAVPSIGEVYENIVEEANIPTNPDSSYSEIITIYYKRQFNIFESNKQLLITGISGIFLFFLIIGSILIFFMRKIIKTQLVEEEKRREVTNALAHDIKTPLFIISGYAQNLKENVNTDKREHYCNRIIERTDEVNSLVHKMLDFSKLGETKQNLILENVDLAELINSVIKDYYDIPDSKSIKFDVTKKPSVNADKELLKRAVSYLFDNAIRYSLDNTDINIILNENSLSISNTCENISYQDLKHLTEPYFRVEKNRESKGNGLGLSIVKSIVELHSFNLSIELNSNVITFTIKF
ncbi:MAG: HAMP domain-containing histidine kinase [Ruminococcus sp.]|nr:HAMP domain-containing histidine kinase [Ruminococcus sp.]